jgi:type IV pilus assembly protein PilC
MAQFNYSSINAEGHQTTGTVVAPNRDAAMNTLRSQGTKILSIKEVKAKGKGFSFSSKPVKIKELVIFTRELSTMIDAGVPLPRSLSTLGEQTENKKFKVVIESIGHDIESGIALADALAKFPNVFSDVYINMVRAGEAGGILNDILLRLATQVEKEAAMRQKIHSAMAYPIAILTITIIAFFGIMLVIMPKIGKIIVDLGGPNAKLPIYTQVMLNASHFMVGASVIKHVPLINHIPLVKSLPNAVFIIVVMFVSLIYFKRYIKTPKGAYRWHSVLLRVPVFGKILAKIAIARFSRTFASLMSSGVTVLEALEVTGKAVGNKVIQKELVEIAEAVRNGQPLGKQLLNAAYFPPIVGQMMTVGEETGKIDEILLKVADFYEQEVDAVIDGMASIIEPIMIVILGGLVGLIAASVMGPIAGLSKNIGG